MKRTISIAAALLFTATAALADIHGSWTASQDERSSGRIYVAVHRGRTMNMGSTMNAADFAGLTAAQIHATTSTPVQFELRREAGTVSFEGSFRNGDGAGQYRFAPNRNFYAAIEGIGVRRSADDDEEKLFAFALHDVSTAYIRSIHAEGIRAGDLDEYLSLRIFNVTPEYIREMRSLGFKDIDADELVASRIHKVTPDYVREMRAAGWDLDLDELQSSRIHGATPEFAAELKKLGYAGLDHDELVSFRIHRVTPELIREYRALGYDKLSADDLVAMRIHRVTPEYIRELAAAGYKNIPPRKLIDMRIHRIDPRELD